MEVVNRTRPCARIHGYDTLNEFIVRFVLSFDLLQFHVLMSNVVIIFTQYGLDQRSLLWLQITAVQ